MRRSGSQRGELIVLRRNAIAPPNGFELHRLLGTGGEGREGVARAVATAEEDEGFRPRTVPVEGEDHWPCSRCGPVRASSEAMSRPVCFSSTISIGASGRHLAELVVRLFTSHDRRRWRCRRKRNRRAPAPSSCRRRRAARHLPHIEDPKNFRSIAVACAANVQAQNFQPLADEVNSVAVDRTRGTYPQRMGEIAELKSAAVQHLGHVAEPGRSNAREACPSAFKQLNSPCRWPTDR